MNILASSLRRIAILASLIIGLGAISQVAAASTPAVAPDAPIAVPSGYKKADVQQVILDALMKRQWVIKDKSDGKVVGYLNHRSQEATITLTYDEKEIQISCEGYEIDKSTGAHKQAIRPDRWLKYLRIDINKLMGVSTAAK